ncbi:CPBP family intramembrane glutamic endopeptidase [Tenacibaculum sp. C7A-26P2]|uniref:CPBP family intramembrane glutamic endopeptidase n=1 Tax=Tenacibaculum sp. C7A-26P2 TaxID=3447504 RepID=UPI003F83B4E7
MPAFILIWMLSNLFFTCISEELLFRGFIQKEVFLFFNNKKGIGLISVSIAAIFFGLAHYKGGVNYVVLSSIAGVFYGYIYYRSGTIKSSIFLHFLFNLTHILLFTYPALRH